MKKNLKYYILYFLSLPLLLSAQSGNKEDLKIKLSEDGKRFLQFTMLNQVWLRYNQSDDGTTVESVPKSATLDIGLRRTRFQLFGQLADRVFVYFQFGQNNFNSQYAIGGNRKYAAFMHDAVCEFQALEENKLKIGAGLTIANGLSRFSQPSISSIMTMDVPVFAQATVDQTDQFSRKLSLYARGQVSRLDYRFSLSDPFPVISNGSTPSAISDNATFSLRRHSLQYQSYLIWQFFGHEPHATPYMAGTYMGNKKIFNIALGGIYQQNAMWRLQGPDTVYQPMMLFCAESFLDMPLNKEKGTAVSAYSGVYVTNYGKNYLRFNGIMNPASGSNISNLAKDVGLNYGNALPMFGTGVVSYSQLGFLLPKDFLSSEFRFMPYAASTFARFDRLKGSMCNTYNAGINCFINGHKAKIALDFQNHPNFLVLSDGSVSARKRRNALVMQYQIFF